MAKAQITLADGTTVALEGTPDEIATTLARLQTDASKPSKKVKGKQRKTKNRPPQITELLASLIDGGFFKKPKDLGAVKAALAEMGHHYPVTTLSPTMLRQVRNKNLRRLRENKRWMYTGGV